MQVQTPKLTFRNYGFCQAAERGIERIASEVYKNEGKITMLTQSETDALFAMPKKPKSSDAVAFPHAGGKLRLPMIRKVEEKR